jgi:hypothetical protein
LLDLTRREVPPDTQEQRELDRQTRPVAKEG